MGYRNPDLEIVRTMQWINQLIRLFVKNLNLSKMEAQSLKE